MESIKPAIVELERIYEAFVGKFGGGLKTRPVITIQTAGRRSALGWMAPKRWQNSADEALNEINICAESLKDGVHEIADTVLHEMVHHANSLRGIRDCSANQYHNKKFAAGCEAVGLVCEKMGRYGWAKTTLSEELRREVDELEIDERAFSLFRRSKKSGPKAENRQRKWTCPCGQIIRGAGELEVSCRKCGGDFTRAD